MGAPAAVAGAVNDALDARRRSADPLPARSSRATSGPPCRRQNRSTSEFREPEPSRPVVDVHAHLVPRAAPRAVAQRRGHVPRHRGAAARVDVSRSPSTAAHPRGPLPPVSPTSGDASSWLDATTRIDVQVVGGWLDIFGYDLARGRGRGVGAGAHGRASEQTVADEPGLIPLGTVPLQAPKRAADALRAAAWPTGRPAS